MAAAGLRVILRAAVVKSVAIFSFHLLFRIFGLCAALLLAHLPQLSPCQPGTAVKQPDLLGIGLGFALTAGPRAASGKPSLLSGWSSALTFAARLNSTA